jgi:hypothetical protein
LKNFVPHMKTSWTSIVFRTVLVDCKRTISDVSSEKEFEDTFWQSSKYLRPDCMMAIIFSVLSLAASNASTMGPAKGSWLLSSQSSTLEPTL